MAKQVAKLIVDYPRLAGALAASFLTWKLLGGHIARTVIGLRGVWGYMRRGMPQADAPVGFFAGILATLKNVATRVKDVIVTIFRSGLGLAPLVAHIKGIGAAIAGVFATIGAPITAIIATVAALVVGLGALIVRNWGRVKDLFASVADFFGAVFAYAAEVVKGWFYIIEPVIVPVLDAVNSFFKAIWDTLKGIGTWIEDKFIVMLERIKGIVDAATEFFRKETAEVKVANAPHEFKKTQEQAERFFKSEEFLNIDSKIQATLADYKAKTGQSDLAEQYQMLQDQQAKIASGDTEIRTRDDLETFTGTFGAFLNEAQAELKKRNAELEEAAMPSTMPAPLAPELPELAPLPQSSMIDRVDPTSVEFVDFRSVADLQTTLESGFTTLANINSGILDTLIKTNPLLPQAAGASVLGETDVIGDKANPLLPQAVIPEPQPSEILAPGVPPLSTMETPSNQPAEVTQHINITINGADKDPEEIAQMVVNELDRQQRTNQFGQ